MSVFNIEIIAVGKLKQSSPFYTLYNDYVRRLNGKVKLVEIEAKSTQEEHQKIAGKLNHNAALVVLDERGKSIPSIEFAHKLETLQSSKGGTLQFVIGGAEGLNDQIRGQADVLLSFGRQAWPHMLARVMLIEQIYRAQQILAKHPYHRE